MLLLLTSAAFAGSTQTNTSGSNTAIEGGYTSSATTTLPLLIYETAFTKFRISQAATLSIITSTLLLLFSIIFIKSMAPKEDD